MFVKETNVEKALVAWGPDAPEWVRLLAAACDNLGQTGAAKQLDKSGGYVSRVLRHDYAGSYDEAEKLVRATFGAEQVQCPLWGEIPLKNCMTLRRRSQPPQNHMHHACKATCPTCPNNTDRPQEEED